MGLLGFRAGNDEQPYGAPLGDRSIWRARKDEPSVSRRVHERLAVHCRRNALVGRELGCERMEAEGRADRESRAVAESCRRGRAIRDAVELGSRPQRPAAE